MNAFLSLTTRKWCKIFIQLTYQHIYFVLLIPDLFQPICFGGNVVLQHFPRKSELARKCVASQMNKKENEKVKLTSITGTKLQCK